MIELDLGRDLDEFAMSIEEKNLRERIKEILKKVAGISKISQTDTEGLENLQVLDEKSEF